VQAFVGAKEPVPTRRSLPAPGVSTTTFLAAATQPTTTTVTAASDAPSRLAPVLYVVHRSWLVCKRQHKQLLPQSKYLDLLHVGIIPE